MIAVFGLGYVECVSAACLASLGHQVTGVDRDQTKVDNLHRGGAPFYEPGLDELVSTTVASGSLKATSSGTNRNFIVRAIPHIGKLILGSLDELLGWADCLVVAQKPSPDLIASIRCTSAPVVDLVATGAFEQARLARFGADPVA